MSAMSPSNKNHSYHLENYKRNTSYCLPASLRPTIVQRQVLWIFDVSSCNANSICRTIPHGNLYAFESYHLTTFCVREHHGCCFTPRTKGSHDFIKTWGINLFPCFRLLMFSISERFELVDCMMDLRKSVIIHGDDVLAHSNWEVGESFIRKYR